MLRVLVRRGTVRMAVVSVRGVHVTAVDEFPALGAHVVIHQGVVRNRVRLAQDEEREEPEAQCAPTPKETGGDPEASGHGEPPL